MLERNNQLHSTQIIPRLQLEVDHRITEALEKDLEADMALVKRKLAFQVANSEVGMEKLLHHFTDCLAYFPISVGGINKKIHVKVLRQRKLNPQFYEMADIIEQKIIEAEIKGRYNKKLLYIST